MLAEAAVQSKDGPYRDFTLSDEDWEAVHIASWLHDCGKMTTSEYVVNKATKLHEKQQKMEDDFAFVASCNEGGEFLDEDRAEHRIERQERDRIEAKNPWDFKVRVPDLLYNRGELYNLLVGRGTLSEEERFKINEHIIQTIVMLSQLPFPKHLRNVPEIAGGHHEKMDGTGYPKQLMKEQMSPVARMIAIADIFEALIAVDRPDKKGKTLSEAIRIMSFMRNDQHIDAELFDLFLRSGVYKQYAEEHMRPEQIDTLEIEEYLKT